MAGRYEAVSKGRDPVVIDALVRAWRTFYVSVGVDIAVLVGAGLMDLLNSEVDVLSWVFWTSALALVVKSFATALATFLLRMKVTPKNVTPAGPPA